MIELHYINTLHVEYMTAEGLSDLGDPVGVGVEWFRCHFPPEPFLERKSPLFDENVDLVTEFANKFLHIDKSSPQWKAHAPALEYELEMLGKTGRQGGSVPWRTAEPIFKAYYNIPAEVYFGDVAKAGLNAFLNMLKGRLRRVAPPNRTREYVLMNTAFGLPFGGKKSVLYKHMQGPFSGWYLPVALLPNVRNMRRKLRAIFASSGLDNDAIQPDLTNVRNWLKREFPNLFGAWHDPRLYVWRDLGSAVHKNWWFLETDFKAMDQHFTWPVVRELILPIYQLLLAPADYLHFAAFVEAAFKAPLQVGTNLWTGEHALFSGLPFTNDFETLYDLVIYLGAHVLSGHSVDSFNRHIKAIGDDVVYYAKTEQQVREVYALVSEEFQRNGVVLSTEKTRIQQGSCRFCRNVYYDRCAMVTNPNGDLVMLPAYPMVLAINNCVQPESTASTRVGELLNCFQRLDNARGNFNFASGVQWLYARMKPELRKPIPDDAEQAFEQLQHKDWWFKVYGTTYTLGESAAFGIYRNTYR